MITLYKMTKYVTNCQITSNSDAAREEHLIDLTAKFSGVDDVTTGSVGIYSIVVVVEGLIDWALRVRGCGS